MIPSKPEASSKAALGIGMGATATSSVAAVLAIVAAAPQPISSAAIRLVMETSTVVFASLIK